MAFKYSVQHVAPGQVRADLLRLWRENLPVEGSGEERFHWLYGDVLEPPEKVFVLAAQGDVAAGPTLVVGAAGVVARSFFAGGRAYRAGLLVDLAVDRAHRTVGPALALVRRARESILGEFDLAYGFPNSAALGVFLRCGYRKLGLLRRYALVLRHADHVRRFVGGPVLPELAGAALDAGRMALLLPRALAAASSFRFEWAPQVDERFDTLWHEAQHAYRMVGQRDATFLRRRFAHHPERARIACLTERAARHAMRAHAVIERRGDTVFLRDLFGHPEDLGALLDLLLVRLRLQNVASVSIWFFGSSTIDSLLRSRGFRRRKSDRNIVFDTGTSLAGNPSLFDDVEGWHLTEADEDT